MWNANRVDLERGLERRQIQGFLRAVMLRSLSFASLIVFDVSGLCLRGHGQPWLAALPSNESVAPAWTFRATRHVVLVASPDLTVEIDVPARPNLERFFDGQSVGGQNIVSTS